MKLIVLEWGVGYMSTMREQTNKETTLSGNIRHFPDENFIGNFICHFSAVKRKLKRLF